MQLCAVAALQSEARFELFLTTMQCSLMVAFGQTAAFKLPPFFRFLRPADNKTFRPSVQPQNSPQARIPTPRVVTVFLNRSRPPLLGQTA